MAPGGREAGTRGNNLSLPRLPSSSSSATKSLRNAPSASSQYKYSTISPSTTGRLSTRPRPGSLRPSGSQREVTSSYHPSRTSSKQLRRLSVPSPSPSTATDAPPKKPATSLEKKGGASATCDKCDGKHTTDKCPWFKKKRENHPDAKNGDRSIGGSTVKEILHQGRIVKQPPDGSCLYHSLCYGLQDPSCKAYNLRSQIATFIQKNPNLKISDTPLKDWVKWDSGSSVSVYAMKMSRGGWGGGIEMAAFSHLKTVNVHVFECSRGSSFQRISSFDVAGAKKTIRVIYRGGVHYDALVI